MFCSVLGVSIWIEILKSDAVFISKNEIKMRYFKSNYGILLVYLIKVKYATLRVQTLKYIISILKLV